MNRKMSMEVFVLPVRMRWVLPLGIAQTWHGPQSAATVAAL
jgi:hypothetical protein